MSTFAHCRLTAEGTLGAGSGNEIWSSSFKIGIWGAGDPSLLLIPTQDELDQLAVVGATIWAATISGNGLGGAGYFDNVVNLTSCKASGVLAATGKNDTNTNPAIAAPTGSSRGSKASPRSNYQNSVVATLRGATYVRGSAALGRIYLPCPNFEVSSFAGNPPQMVDGLMHADTVFCLATQVAALITTISSPNNPLTSGHEHAVVNIGQSEDAAGVRWQRVNRVTMDNRPDSVRRRYSALSGRAVQTVAV